MRSEAKTVADYLAGLPTDRRQALSALRSVVLENLPKGYEENMNWGMICYEVPLPIEPKTHNGKPLLYVALASQKHHMGLYLCGLPLMPGAEARLAAAWKASGRKLDMGKACIRFKQLADLDLALIAETIASISVAEFVKVSKR